MKETMQQIEEAAGYIRQHISGIPRTAIILGSGLGYVFSGLTDTVTLRYEDIPYFKASTVPGHAGELIYGMYNGNPILIMKGRFHYYEGHDTATSAFPVRVFASLGTQTLIVTNAAGGISDTLHPGSIMLISDHIGFLCPSPLRGPNLDKFGPRFKDMTEVYSIRLRELAKKAAAEAGIEVTEGIYCFSPGPQYETPAEIRAYKLLGADAVGMSTVPEAIIARHCDMEILGVSLITNKAAGLSANELSHEDVEKVAALARDNVAALIKKVTGELYNDTKLQ